MLNSVIGIPMIWHMLGQNDVCCIKFGEKNHRNGDYENVINEFQDKRSLDQFTGAILHLLIIIYEKFICMQ